MSQRDQVPGGGAASYPDAATFGQVAAAFEELRLLPPDSRAPRLQALARDAAAVADEVRRLLSWHEQEHGRLAEPEQAIDQDLLAAAFADEPDRPQRLGPWLLQQRIGAGGMGAVYRAERADAEFQQVAALKLLHPSAGGAELQQRFRTERRILASLRHPNIAALLDGGTTPDGRGWVAMEYVEGQNLMAHAEGRALPLRARLDLFIKVCGAVEHAHRNLVVHRDLKPANILVTAEGEPKLLDFGIAKLLQREGTEALTATGSLLLTPEYASPEQVRGENITTATDVYALGVILHELLTGQRAQSFTTRTPRELEQVICERQPPPPSRALALPLPAMGLSSTRLRKLLAGDLDTIVQRAQHKDPLRRYGSAGELADDVRRHLRGLPVLARPDSFTYVARKFLKRHRWPVAAAVVLVATLLVATLVTAGMARTAARQRDVAERKSAIAAQISDFLVDLFHMAEPDAARAEQLSARALLDRGSSRIASDLGTAPLLRAGLQDAMGRAYTRLGLYDAGAGLLAESLALRRQHGAEPRSVIQTLQHLGQLLTARADFAQAESLLQEALRLSEQAGDGAELAASEASLANLLNEMGRDDEALPLAQRSLGRLVALHGKDDPRAAHVLLLVANLLRDRGDFAEALERLQEALAVLQRRFGEDNPVAADVHRAIGATHKEMGEYAPARDALQRAIDLDRRLLGEDHPDVQADLFTMAMLEDQLGEPREAERLLRQVLERDVRAFGERHAFVALDLGQIASVLGRRGDVAEAEPMFQKALAMQRELLPKDHPELATTLNNLGVLYHRLRRYDDAEPCMTEALAIRERILPADHPALLTSRNILAVLMQDRGDPARAEVQFRSVLDARRRTLGDHPHTAGSCYSLAMAVAAQGRREEAEPLVRESLRIYRAKLPPLHLDLGRPLRMLGALLRDGGDAAGAEPLLREAVECRRKHLEAEHPDVASAECDLGRCLTQLGRLDEAAAVLEQARARCAAGPGLDHPVGKRVLQAVAEVEAARRGK